MSGIATLQRHIEDKARAVLDGYLASRLAASSVPGVSDRVGALRVAVGLDPTQTSGSVATDTLPRVDLYCVDANPEYDITGDGLSVAYTYEVSAVAQFDGSDFSAAARSSQELCGIACETLERYLRDAGGVSGSIYRVDTTSPVRSQSQMFDVAETRLYTMQSLGELTIYGRAVFVDEPTYAPVEIEPGRPTLFGQLADITSGLDASSGLGAAEANRLTTWTVSSGDLAGASDIIVDTSPAFAWADSGSVAIYLQRHGATVSGDPTATTAITLAAYSVADGDRWVIFAADDGPDGTRHHATWAIDWSVTA